MFPVLLLTLPYCNLNRLLWPLHHKSHLNGALENVCQREWSGSRIMTVQMCKEELLSQTSICAESCGVWQLEIQCVEMRFPYVYRVNRICTC